MMARSKPNRISSLLTNNKSSAAHELIRHSSKLQQLEQLVQDSLPRNLSPHCTMANYRENILVLHVDSAIWSSKLRFFIPTLEYELKQHYEFTHLKQVIIKTRPNYSKHHQASPQKASMSKNTADLLNNLADYVTNEDLASALRKLSKHGRETD